MYCPGFSTFALLAALFPPPDSSGGWRTADPGLEVRTALDAAFDRAKTTSRHGGLLVVLRGRLAYERYWGRGHREAAPNLASCGKSFTSIAAGILLAERPELFPDGLDTRVFTPRHMPPAAFPLNDPAKAEIGLGQLLAMTAGIAGNNPGYVLGREVLLDKPGPDGWQAVYDSAAFAVPLWTRPGGGYSYATASVHIVSAMIRHITGMELQEFLEQRLARPLGWGRWGFGYRRQEVDHTPGGGGIAVRATDMLRFGYLLLNEGLWGRRQIVPAEYVRKATRRSPYNPHFPYSLQFSVNDGGAVAGLPRDAFWKAGSGGHCLCVVPSLGLVIWKLGGRDEQYNPALVNVPPPAEPLPPYDGSRDNWKPETRAEFPAEVLRMIVDAFRVKPEAQQEPPMRRRPAGAAALAK